VGQRKYVADMEWPLHMRGIFRTPGNLLGEEETPMKRMAKDDRNFWIDRQYGKLFHDLTCRYGEWSRDKLLDEFEKKLKRERQNRC